MDILVIGSGGREHAIVKTLKKSEKAGKIYAAPGNAGTAADAENVSIGVLEFDKIADFAIQNKIDLVFVAPDDPLSLGLVDFLTEKGIRAFGPVAAAAKIESSKSFSKDLMEKYGIPTAKSQFFTDYDSLVSYLEKSDYPIVIKADGLALGKGVFIAQNFNDAKDAADAIMLEKRFGDSGNKVLTEEFLSGREVTVLAFSDGKTLKCMPASQDHKKAYDGDRGLNTGGMGAFAPSPYFTKELYDEFYQNIALKTVDALNSEGITFKGVIYFGLMLTNKGIKVIEYNARFGDPETQVILPLLKTDFIDIIDACIDGTLDKLDIKWENKTALNAVIATGGYPASSDKGLEITIDKLTDDVILFHAGTKLTTAGKIVTNGGRVFNVTAIGDNLDNAREKVYAEIDKITFKGSRYRKDIGLI